MSVDKETEPGYYSKVEMKLKPKFKALDVTEGDYMEWDEFAAGVKSGGLSDDDGFGHLATSTQVSDVTITPSDLQHFPVPLWVTHVLWYNR